MKKWIALLLVVVSLFTAAVPAMAAAAAIEKVEYDGSGRVEVEWRRNVQYKSAKVTVKDEDGKSYTAKIREKDKDDLTFKVSSIAPGKSYSFTISGVRAGKSGSYGSVSGSFRVPAAKALAIRGMDYDAEDRELEIEFNTKVQYKRLKVQVKDSSGKSYSVSVRDYDSDGVEVRVKGLTRGETYAVQVKGIRVKGSGDSYGKLTTTFVAR